VTVFKRLVTTIVGFPSSEFNPTEDIDKTRDDLFSAPVARIPALCALIKSLAKIPFRKRISSSQRGCGGSFRFFPPLALNINKKNHVWASIAIANE